MSNTTQNSTRGRSAKSEVRSRTRRIPMSGSRMRMHIEEADKDPNYHYAWFNDKDGQIQRAKMAGFEFCTRAEFPAWGEMSVDSSDGTSAMVEQEVGGGITAYLMKQPMEYHLEDRAELDKMADDREADLKKLLDSENGTYGNLDISRK